MFMTIPFDEQEYNASLEVVSSCSSEDLYCGSDSDLDEEEMRGQRKEEKGESTMISDCHGITTTNFNGLDFKLIDN